MKEISVAAGIIVDQQNSKVLIAQRPATDYHAGKWEYPGGKIEIGELAVDALARELKEELGILVQSVQIFIKKTHHYADSSVCLFFYLVTKFTGVPTGLEGQNIKWVNLTDLKSIDMLAANSSINDDLISRYGISEKY